MTSLIKGGTMKAIKGEAMTARTMTSLMKTIDYIIKLSFLLI
jgi:hypothetical protein